MEVNIFRYQDQEATESDQAYIKQMYPRNQKKVCPSPLDKKTYLSPIIALLVSQAVF